MERPIKVVMFGSGPRLTPDAELFLYRLETHPQIDLLGAFCQATSQSFRAVVQDLWKRRGVLALPLLVAMVVDRIGRFFAAPRATRESQKLMGQLANRLQFVSDIHDPLVLERVRSLEPDLGLVYGSPILKPKLFEIPTLGTLGIHHGKLPQYRGNKTMFWAMYHGETTAGVTIQKINAGLDTGSIVKEGEALIGRRSQRKVWRDLEAIGLDLYIKAILEVRDGTAEFRPQTGPKGKLYRNPKPADFLQFWFRQMKRRLE